MRVNRELTGEVWRLALPTIIALLSTTIMGVADTAMVGRLNAAALAAVGLGGIMLWTLVSTSTSISTGVQTLVARRHGEKNYLAGGQILSHGLILASGLGLIVFILGLLLYGRIMGWVNNDPDVVRYGGEYLQARNWSVVAVVIYMAFYGFFNGIGKTRIHMRISLAANALNIVLNYGLIFGHLGLPRMEVAGAGIATSIAAGFQLLLYIIAAAHPSIRKIYKPFGALDFSPDRLWRLTKLAWPVSLQNVFAMGGFSVFLILMGLVGTNEMAATEIVFQVLGVSFMPGHGFGVAAQTLVSRYMGDKNFALARESGWTAMGMGVIFMGLMGVFFFIFPGFIMRLFTTVPEVIQGGILALRILAVVQFADAIGLVLEGALRGAGDSRFPALAETSLNWGVFLPLTWYWALHLGWGLVGGWWALLLYIVLFAASQFWRFSRPNWESIEV